MPAMALVGGEIDDFGLLLVAFVFGPWNFDSDDEAAIIKDLIEIKAIETSVTPVDTAVR